MVVVRHDRKAKHELETSICKAHKASSKQFDNSTSENIYGPGTKYMTNCSHNTTIGRAFQMGPT